MTKLPDLPPPDILRERAPVETSLHFLGPDTVLWRIHATAGSHVVGWNRLRHYGPAAGRFDPQRPPAGQSPRRGVLYLAAERVEVAVAETFQRTRRVDVTAGSPWLTGMRLTRQVGLLDLCGTWPTRAGASQALSSGPHARAQAWARAITEAWPALEGLWYPSSMRGGGRCVALWAPATDALPESPEVSVPLSHPGVWGSLALACERLGYLLG